MNLDFKILLGSNSPRRRELLTASGYAIRCMNPGAEESFPDSLSAHDVPAYIANAKAEVLQKDITGDEILITADTIVLCEDKILGKPADRADAAQMLRLLSGKKHEVITGVVFQNRETKLVRSGITGVYFEHFTDEEIYYYIDHYNPLDKAGAYGIQDWAGWCKVARIEGSYTNVMGLPMEIVYAVLNEYF